MDDFQQPIVRVRDFFMSHVTARGVNKRSVTILMVFSALMH